MPGVVATQRVFHIAYTQRGSRIRIISARKANDEALQDAARFTRRVRKRLGLTQLEFSERIDVSLDTIRNWEQGKRRPAGAAKALLKVLDKAPETALRILG